MHIRVGRIAVVAALVGAAAAIAPASAAQAAVACEVTYTASSWSGGFYANVQIKNLGDPWNGYTVDFRFTGDQTVTQAWNHSWTQSGQAVTVRSGPSVPPVPTGGSIWLGFLGRYTGTNTPPTGWRVNGVACSVTGQPAAVVAEPDVVTIPEGGGGTFSVRLSHPPAQQVALGMSITGTGTWASPPVVLIFTPTNWSTPQIYPVMSPDDPDAVDDRAVVTLSATGYTSDTVILQQVDGD
ncbi:cellulose binding domain-containing protein [Phytohabitans sp. LJ34]|uniref:cellulose binding domain-containing protein n=1 Tax=Phytohabitans sp. LJ34 TaxID=3452217 RepID=UPI003F8BEF6B